VVPHSIELLKKTWDQLGQDDPLWAVVSDPAKRRGKWALDDFLATGERDVTRLCELIGRWGQRLPPFDHVLDFGCGVGRLTLAWSKRARTVTGVDISATMIQKARAILQSADNVTLKVNSEADLRCLPANLVDLVASHICLQHMPWSLAEGYVREFARVARPDGLVVFQVPSSLAKAHLADTLKKKLVESLPFGWGARYRRWRRGTDAVFEMHFTPVETVLASAEAAGLKLLHREPDLSAGDSTEGFIYLFQVPRRV